MNSLDNDSIYSVDSLEAISKVITKPIVKKTTENRDQKFTIKIHKCKNEKKEDCMKLECSRKTPLGELPNYLLNRTGPKEKKKKGYLDMFRERIYNCSQNSNKKIIDKAEIWSIAPELGDSQTDSLQGSLNNLHFTETECYNDIVYDQILEAARVKTEEDLPEKSTMHELDSINTDKLSSITSTKKAFKPRSRSLIPLSNVRLGGLGADIGRIRPQLDRARSLRRYSDKIKEDNRIKIYTKKFLEESGDKERAEKDSKAETKKTTTKTVKNKPKTIFTKIAVNTNKNSDSFKKVDRNRKTAPTKPKIIKNNEKSKLVDTKIDDNHTDDMESSYQEKSRNDFIKLLNVDEELTDSEQPHTNGSTRLNISTLKKINQNILESCDVDIDSPKFGKLKSKLNGEDFKDDFKEMLYKQNTTLSSCSFADDESVSGFKTSIFCKRDFNPMKCQSENNVKEVHTLMTDQTLKILEEKHKRLRDIVQKFKF